MHGRAHTHTSQNVSSLSVLIVNQNQLILKYYKYVFGGWASAIKQLEGMQLQVSAHVVVTHPRRSHVTKADDVADLRGASWIHLAISCNWIWFICLGTPHMCQIQADPGAYVSSLVLWSILPKPATYYKAIPHAFPSAVTFRLKLNSDQFLSFHHDSILVTQVANSWFSRVLYQWQIPKRMPCKDSKSQIHFQLRKWALGWDQVWQGNTDAILLLVQPLLRQEPFDEGSSPEFCGSFMTWVMGVLSVKICSKKFCFRLA